MTEHKHEWKVTMHLDGCHWYTSSYACACGAAATRTNERSPREDLYSIVWMEPEYVEVNRDERGRFARPHVEERRCARCEELIAGAPTRHDFAIIAKGGAIELERHEEHEQRDPEPEDDE
jgi:hypothetical protein